MPTRLHHGALLATLDEAVARTDPEHSLLLPAV
jgi:hypothetical protein